MKFALVLCAVLGLSFGAVVPRDHHHHHHHHHDARDLGDLLDELLSMIPVDKIAEIVVHYVETDPEVQEALAYLKSDDFKNLATTVENSQQFHDLAKFLNDSGLDIYHYIDVFNDLLGLPHFEPKAIKSVRFHNTRSLMDMINDILAVIPLDKILQFYHDKVENDPEFQELLKRLRSPEFKELVNSIKNMPEYTDLLNRLKQHGIDVDAIVKAIDDFFGWGFFSLHHQRSLGDLLNELLSMIPVDKIAEIVVHYVETDPEVQEALAYLKSDDFKNLATTVENSQQFHDLAKFLNDSGLDIYHYIDVFNDLLGLPHFEPKAIKSVRFHNTRSLMDMINDILAVIPLDKILQFYHDKVENDPEFQELLKRLRSPEFKELVDSIKNMPEYTDLLNRLKNHGIDVDAIVKAIDDFFGWGFFSLHHQRSLGDLFDQLLAMIPVDKIIEIVTNYIENDPEVQEAVAFLKSDEFKSLVEKIQNMPQYMEYLEYLYNAGIDVYKYINYVHGLLGLPPVHRPGSRHSTRSLLGMIQDILNVLPLDEMEKFYHEKVENDPDFQELLAKLKSDEFKNIVNTIRNMPEYIDMMDRLRNHGIDVDAIRKVINDFFGWGSFSLHHQRSLGDLFDQLLAMIPVDKIIEIVTNYIENDPEVQEAVAFLKSDEFKSLVEKIQNMPQYMEYLEYLYNAGIDVYKYINYVHGLLGLPPVHRPGSRHSTRSLLGMIQDILNVLPLDEMEKFYHEKVENDPDFQELLAKLKSDEFKNIVNTIRNMPEYIDMMDRLRNHGIDVDAIRKVINDFFGWGSFSLHHQRSLGDLFDQLLAMIPVDKIIEIVTNYIENDPEVQEAVAFLKSDEFKSLVEKIQNMPQYMEYLEYLYNAGIDVYKYINYVHGLLGLPPVHRPGSRHSTRSLLGMIQDILNVLPLDEMEKFYHEKVENDPDFQELLAKLKSDEFKNIVNTIRNMPEYIDMMDRLRNHGIDVDAIRKVINDFFGW